MLSIAALDTLECTQRIFRKTSTSWFYQPGPVSLTVHKQSLLLDCVQYVSHVHVRTLYSVMTVKGAPAAAHYYWSILYYINELQPCWHVP